MKRKGPGYSDEVQVYDDADNPRSSNVRVVPGDISGNILVMQHASGRYDTAIVTRLTLEDAVSFAKDILLMVAQDR